MKKKPLFLGFALLLSFGCAKRPPSGDERPLPEQAQEAPEAKPVVHVPGEIVNIRNSPRDTKVPAWMKYCGGELRETKDGQVLLEGDGAPIVMKFGGEGFLGRSGCCEACAHDDEGGFSLRASATADTRTASIHLDPHGGIYVDRAGNVWTLSEHYLGTRNWPARIEGKTTLTGHLRKYHTTKSGSVDSFASIEKKNFVITFSLPGIEKKARWDTEERSP